jgi:hypothetical protein
MTLFLLILFLRVGHSTKSKKVTILLLKHEEQLNLDSGSHPRGRGVLTTPPPPTIPHLQAEI